MISSTLITDYLLSKMTNYSLVSGGTEMIVPSIFVDNDYKRHMSINVETGLWQCFKSGEKGNFVKLYSILENKTIKQAYDELVFKSFFIGEEPIPRIVQEKKIYENELEGLEEVKYKEIYTGLALKAWQYLSSRKLFDFENDSLKYFVSNSGRYKNRLIIPIFLNEKMIFFQARALDNDTQPKYLCPVGLKASHVLPPFDYSRPKLFITEGPTDYLTLKLSGLNATCTFGSYVSHEQIKSLRTYEGDIILAYDNDEAGWKGVQRFDEARKYYRLHRFYITHPPKKYKDWNEAYVAGEKLNNLSIKKYDYSYKLIERLHTLGD